MSLPDNGEHFDNPDVIKNICSNVRLKKEEWHYRNKHCDKCEKLFHSVVNLSNGRKAVCFHNCAKDAGHGAWCFAKLFMP